MGVPGLVGRDASEEVVLAREVVDSDGVALVWMVEVRILLSLWLLWRTGEREREVIRETLGVDLGGREISVHHEEECSSTTLDCNIVMDMSFSHREVVEWTGRTARNEECTADPG